MKTVLVPKASMSCLNFWSSPEMNDAMTITVTVPITTPSTVRNERNLWACSVANAILKLSVVSCLLILVRPKRLNRIEFRGFPRRVDPKEQTDARRDGQRHERPEDRQGRREIKKNRRQFSESVRDGDADAPPKQRKHG